jgi:hypothetical protein
METGQRSRGIGEGGGGMVTTVVVPDSRWGTGAPYDGTTVLGSGRATRLSITEVGGDWQVAPPLSSK